MSSLPITSLYAGILGLLLVALSIRVVVVVRGKGNVGYGDGGQSGFTTVVRAQGNFIEYVPIALILMGIIELGGSGNTLLHALGASLVVARILHPMGLREEPGPTLFRVVGTAGTWIIIAVASVVAILQGLSA